MGCQLSPGVVLFPSLSERLVVHQVVGAFTGRVNARRFTNFYETRSWLPWYSTLSTRCLLRIQVSEYVIWRHRKLRILEVYFYLVSSYAFPLALENMIWLASQNVHLFTYAHRNQRSINVESCRHLPLPSRYQWHLLLAWGHLQCTFRELYLGHRI
jgi:hypothetical protein